MMIKLILEMPRHDIAWASSDSIQHAMCVVCEHTHTHSVRSLAWARHAAVAAHNNAYIAAAAAAAAANAGMTSAIG